MRHMENVFFDENNNIIIRTFRSSVKPGRRILNDHHHTECEVSAFLSGSGIYSVHGQEYSFSSGDIFLFGSNEAHCITEIYEDLNLLNVHFEPRILWERHENVDLLKLFFERSKNFSNKFPEKDETLSKTLIRLEKEIAEKKIGHTILVKCLLFSALVYILRAYDCSGGESSFSKNLSLLPNLKDAIFYIDQHLDKNITLKEISDVACMSPTYFSAVFKKFNGISPWEYITIKRVEAAIEMIKSTNMTKLEIAEKCGFSSSSNFYKAFFAVTGKKPGDYAAGS